MKTLSLIRETIKVSPHDYTITVESEEFRNALALRGLQIQEVTNAEQNAEAAAVVGDIRRHVKDVNAVRLAISRPLDEAKARLIELAKDHCSPLLEIQDRLERIGTEFVENERRRVEAEERARRDELARLERERLETERKLAAERLAAERERQRIEAEAEAKAASIKSARQRAIFEAQQQRLADERAERDHAQAVLAAAGLEAKQKELEAAIRAPLPEAERATGQSSRRYVKFRVTDARAVFTARPELCTLEVKPSAVSAVCFPKPDASESAPDTSIPGMEMWWELKLTYRSK